MAPSSWLVFFRLSWLFGFSKGCESYKFAKNRAIEAAAFLVNHAKEQQNAVLVGHGIFNRLIGNELQKAGWEKVTEKFKALGVHDIHF